VAQYEAQMRRLEHDYERGRNLIVLR